MSDQDGEKKTYWFPAKKVGWGWGLPSLWQGWATLIIYLGLMGVNLYLFPPEEEPVFFTLMVILLSAGLVAVCWFKGEPPGSRLGK